MPENKKKIAFALKFAPTWKRIVSYLIDYILLMTIFILMISKAYETQLNIVADQVAEMVLAEEAYEIADIQVMFSESITNQQKTIIFGAFFLLFNIYFSLFWAGTGQTLGNRLMRIAVIDIKSSKMKPLQAIMKSLLLWLSTFAYYIPLIFIVNPIFRQRLHDMISKSVVIEIPKNPEDMIVRKKDKTSSESAETSEIKDTKE